jgi:transcriptional regulator with PAS, ATPase and Fis domain
MQSKSFQRIGGKEDVTADVRIIATTNRSLEVEMKAGRLREDLFHSLAILPVQVPPLRERIQDIADLADKFRLHHARKAGREVLAFSATALQALLSHTWPGNLRELEFVVAQAVIRVAEGRILEPADLFPNPAPFGGKPLADTGDGNPPGEDLATVEKRHIFAMLEQCQNNRTHAARRLGISIRTLRNKLREYRNELDPSGSKTGDGEPTED